MGKEGHYITDVLYYNKQTSFLKEKTAASIGQGVSPLGWFLLRQIPPPGFTLL